MKKRKDNDFDIKAGARLKEYREKANLTQQEVADKLGVTKTAVSNWETGDRAMYLSVAKKYCRLLDISVDDITKDI